MTDKPQIHFIQALRALAAMMVLIWHFRPAVKGDIESSVLTLFFANGFSGVDVFFVISGFIMVYSTGGRSGGAKNALVFLAKRFARIWPLYAFGTILYVLFLISLGWMTTEEYIKTALSLVFYPVAPAPTLDVGWTLNIEIYFYLVFSFCLLFNRLRWLVAGTWITLTVAVQSMVTDFSFVPPSLSFLTPLLGQAIHPCIPEFFAGMVIAAFFMSNITVSKRMGLPIAGLLVSFAVWQYLDGFYNKPGIYGMGAGAIALVLGFAIAEKSGAGWKPGAVLMWLGNISFSIYILHTTVGLALTRVLKNTPLADHLGIGYVVFLIVVVLLLSTLPHALIEQRLSTALSQFITARITRKQPNNAQDGVATAA
ncbi:acyltransferase family protein [Pseudomonas fontis]|uniref:Acyltransferase n=1 Tax=Pseudomonas fontis TaxID=2942633 RepID=A0ABT5NVH1_9PSED|nr:acyltransferase [Pseudomonas fontis]MDD0975535.1 acyltransferase [Pseudomonas fontis]MDD0992173.1 acyltransferase [Pseudomonas fontis]